MADRPALEPVWLVRTGTVLCAAVRATSRTDRRRGLLGVDQVAEPLVIQPCSWVHTVGMRISLDVAHVGHDGTVIAISQMKPWRIGSYVRGSHLVIEAGAGSFERWNMQTGDVVEVRDVAR